MTDTERDGAPWWASGAHDLRDDVDPFDAHRRAREHGVPADGPGRAGPWTGTAGRSGADDARSADTWAGGWGGADAAARTAGGRGARPGLEDAVEAIGALARAAARRAAPGGARAEDPGSRRGPGHDPACRSCPVCLLTRSLGDARPEVVEHLEQAARHLVLAARAWVDAAEQRTGWERIELDEDEPVGDGPTGRGWDDQGRQAP